MFGAISDIKKNPGQNLFTVKYLHFSKTSLDEPLDVHLCSYFHEHIMSLDVT